MDSNVALENIEVEECMESKVYRINTAASRDTTQNNNNGRVLGAMSTRSGGNTKHQNENPMKQQMIRVKNITKARNAGSVGAREQRDKSLVSTQQSTPEKKEDFDLTLWSEIHRNLVAGDNITRKSPLDTHSVSKEYRTKMVDWMVEVTTSFKCTTRTYFLAVAIFDTYCRL